MKSESLVAFKEDVPGVGSQVLGGLESEGCIVLLMFCLLPVLLVLFFFPILCK